MRNAKRLLFVILAITLFGVFKPAATYAAIYPVGYGSSNPPAFGAAYNRIGGAPRVGYAYNAVHTWNNGCIQDFSGGWSGTAAIMQYRCYGPAYNVIYTFWSYMVNNWGGGASSVVGYPVGDDSRQGNGWVQHFIGGSLGDTTLAKADQTGKVKIVWGNIRTLWIYSAGGASGFLGYPLTEEYAWNNIRRQDFQGGSIIWDPINRARLLYSRESHAVNYVISEKNSPLPSWSDEFGRYWSGYCEGFVEVAFGTRNQFTSAIAQYYWQLSQGRIHSDSNPPAGAIVFYGGGGGFGHVGVSIGSGQAISTQGYSGQTLPIWQHSVTGLSNPYLGWAYAPPSWPGR